MAIQENVKDEISESASLNTTKKLSLVVLLSGDGSIFEAIATAIEEQRLDARILMVISDNPKAYGLICKSQNLI